MESYKQRDPHHVLHGDEGVNCSCVWTSSDTLMVGSTRLLEVLHSSACSLCPVFLSLPLPSTLSSSSFFWFSSVECDLWWPWPALLGILHTWRDLNRTLGPFQMGTLFPFNSVWTYLQPPHINMLLSSIYSSCFAPDFGFICSVFIQSVFPLSTHKLQQLFPLLFSAALSFDEYLSSELWQSFPPLLSPVSSPPTVVIIGLVLMLINNNVLLPHKRPCCECRKAFWEPQAWLECFSQWIELAWVGYQLDAEGLFLILQSCCFILLLALEPFLRCFSL